MPFPNELRHWHAGCFQGDTEAVVAEKVLARRAITSLEDCMLLMILIVLLVVSVAGGGWGHSRYGFAGWSPAGILVLLCVVLWFTGNLHI
jgi:uncharacterized membrane protein YkvI